ncbi:hypothetical protein RDMS_09025 [Deinococcus sp. RL]|uniref:hypothetical protein n=1 Tax=Deinococcus sp. RL TaxID=1489678 RepID=UPI0004D60F74|nr:hypothetical protein [Deinococcus sp. RL]KEF34100.1 hypothetical protein RDMS_09025 [Deinococcus sp. RL]
MTRRKRLAALEARQGGGGLEVWQEVEDAPGTFRQVFPRAEGTGHTLTAPQVQALRPRPALRVFAVYGDAP